MDFLGSFGFKIPKKSALPACNQPFLKYPGGTAQASGGVAEPYLAPPWLRH